MTKEEVIEKLNEAFEPRNVECDGAACMGCWKDVVREVIKKLQEPEPTHEPNVFYDNFYKPTNDELVDAVYGLESQLSILVEALEEVDRLFFAIQDHRLEKEQENCLMKIDELIKAYHKK